MVFGTSCLAATCLLDRLVLLGLRIGLCVFRLSILIDHSSKGGLLTKPTRSRADMEGEKQGGVERRLVSY